MVRLLAASVVALVACLQRQRLRRQQPARLRLLAASAACLKHSRLHHHQLPWMRLSAALATALSVPCRQHRRLRHQHLLPWMRSLLVMLSVVAMWSGRVCLRPHPCHLPLSPHLHQQVSIRLGGVRVHPHLQSHLHPCLLPPPHRRHHRCCSASRLEWIHSRR